VPPLRERAPDLLPLAAQLLEQLGARSRISGRARLALRARTFRGNVRELDWTLTKARTFAAGGEIDVQHLPEEWPLHWWAES
jgi:DNA-binding NtrC family response regulator